MTDRIRDFFDNQISPDAPPIYVDRLAELRRRLDAAACALLLELAHADEEFSDAERTHIEAVVRQHFGLYQAGAQELIAAAEAERSQATDLYQLTDLIRGSYDLSQKRGLVEILWGLALSDGEIAQHEAYMMTKIASLLDLPEEELADARKRVEAKAGAPPRG